MDEPLVRLSYDGGDASRGAIDMRLLGQSLQGLDRIISDGLIILVHERLPKRGERAPLILKVKEPERGSYFVPGFLQDAAPFLALGIPVIADAGSAWLTEWVKMIVAKFTGRGEAVEAHLAALADIAKGQIEAADRADERRHQEIMAANENSHVEKMAMIGLLREGARPLGFAAEQFVAPIGPSATSGLLGFGDKPAVPVTVEQADEIWEFGRLEWSGLAELSLETDGFKFHSNGLSVEHPEKEGFLMAKVSDPRFAEPENVYTEAAGRRSTIVVLARRGYRESTLAQIDIVDFVREEPSA